MKAAAVPRGDAGRGGCAGEEGGGAEEAVEAGRGGRRRSPRQKVSVGLPTLLPGREMLGLAVSGVPPLHLSGCLRMGRTSGPLRSG